MSKQLQLFNDMLNTKIRWENIRMVGDDKDYRYILRSEGNNPLVVIGVNPSTANEKAPDATMRKVMGFAEYNGFDSFIMANLYPQRTTDPNALHDCQILPISWKNRFAIKKELDGIGRSPTILAAWGNLITKRSYLNLCLRGIVEILAPLNPSWKCIRISKAGHPVHPLYQRYCKLKNFDIVNYINNVL